MNRSSLLGYGLVIVAAGACQQQSSPPPAASGKAATEAVTVQASPSPSPRAPQMAAALPATPTTPAPLRAQVRLPPQLAAGQKAPLLLMLHSIGTSAEDIESRTDWPKFAERNGLAWIAPNGPIDSAGRRFWDAGASCCNFTGQRIDHVAALRELLARTIEENPIDRGRVFVGGISNGGFMAHRFACEAPELVHGVVSISGAGPLEDLACKTPNALRVLEIHGDADRIVSYAGGHFFGMAVLPRHASVQKTVGDWAVRLACSGEPTQAEPLDLEKRFAGKETKVTRYRECQRGALELWTVTGGDHYLAFHEPSPQRIWEFLNQKNRRDHSDGAAAASE